MKQLILSIFVLFILKSAYAQNPTDYFNKAANQFIDKSTNIALNTLNEGISKFPNDASLRGLKKRLEEEQKKENKDDKNQENKQDQKKDGEKGNKDDKKKESEQGKDDKKKEEGKDQNSGEEEKDQAGKEDQKGENQQEKKDQQQDKKDASKPDDKNDKDQKKQENSKPSQQMNSEVIGIPEEKAKAILEAMRQNEIKYLQNKRRKPTKQPSNGKPDW